MNDSRRTFASSILIALFACAQTAYANAAPSATASEPPPTAPRIVSLIPSMTEDLFAIGAGAQVVGVSEYTDFPNDARALPIVASITSLNAERIEQLHPDLVVGIAKQDGIVRDLRRIGLHVVLFPDNSFDDLFTTLATLGTLSGHEPQAIALAKQLHARTAALVATVPAGPHPRVLVVLGTSPIYTVGDGSYIAHLIALAGGRNASGIGDPYARLGPEAVFASQPDVIVADSRGHLPEVLDTEPWRSLQAVRSGHAYVLEDADILLRPGPRYNEGLAWLIEHLHGHAAQK